MICVKGSNNQWRNSGMKVLVATDLALWRGYFGDGCQSRRWRGVAGTSSGGVATGNKA